jgi:hypothetical protein
MAASCRVVRQASFMTKIEFGSDVVLTTVARNHIQRVTGFGECKVLVPTINGGRSCVLHLKSVRLAPESPIQPPLDRAIGSCRHLR